MSLATPSQKHCADCGTAFDCGMGQDTPCWCSREFAPVMPLTGPGADCYCPGCLAKHIARSQLEKLKTPL
jgi:Cysteine-rich CWC